MLESDIQAYSPNLLHRLQEKISLFIDSKHLQGINRTILAAVSSQIGNDLTNFILLDSKESHRRCHEYLEIMTWVLHSQAWLSPTFAYSPVRERGILQGDACKVAYERSQMQPAAIERHFATEVFHSENALLFRNAVSAASDLFDAVLQSNASEGVIRKIAVSAQFPRELLCGIEGKYAVLPHYSGEGRAGAVTEYFSENEIDVVVIDDRDENDLPAFLEKLVEYNRSIPRQKISFVVVFCSRSFRLPPNLTERLNDDGINLFGLHELTSVLTGPAIHSPSPAMVVLYSRGVQTKRLAEYMMRMRRYGGNIDLLTETYLSLLIGCPIENTRDDNPLPGYHELIDGESLGRRVEELRSNYRRLLDDFDAACPSRPLFAELLQTLRQRVTQHLLFLDGRVGTNPLNDTTQQQLRNILVEYRTIVKYSIYMRWYEIRQRNGSDAMRAVLKTGLEQRLLEYTSPCLDAGGKQLPRSVLLFSSGMAVCKSLLHFLAGEDRRVQRKLIVANTMYYEIERVLRMLRYEELPCDPVLESQAIIGAVASGAYKAIFMDPIANMVQLEGSSEKRLHANSRNLPALDIALIIDGLCRMQFDRPFYVVIDNSMFGVCFQIADYLNNRSVPRNLYFIVCGSIQKLYEKGLEVSGGGWLMVVSSDPEGHSNVMERLRLQCGGGELPLFNLVALEAVLGTKGCQEERTIRIMKNAEQLARHVQESLSFAGFDVGVFHPALVTHPDHAAWIASGRTGLPFFMLNLGKLFNDRLIVAVNDRMKKCGLSGFEARESYGFDRLTYCYYNPGTQEEAVRVSLAPYITEEMSSIKRIFSEAIDAIAPEIKRLETTGIHSPGECCS